MTILYRLFLRIFLLLIHYPNIYINWLLTSRLFNIRIGDSSKCCDVGYWQGYDRTWIHGRRSHGILKLLSKSKKKKKVAFLFLSNMFKKKIWDCLVIFNRNTQIWYLPKFLCMLAFVWLYLIHPNIFPNVIHIVAMTMYTYMFLSVQCLVHIYILNGSKKIVFFLTLFVYICGFCPMTTRF